MLEMAFDITGSSTCTHLWFLSQVRTIISNAGLEVIGLKRVRIGGYRMPRSLGFGQFVALKQQETRRVCDRGAQYNV